MFAECGIESESTAAEEGFTEIGAGRRYGADLQHRKPYEYRGSSILARGGLPLKSNPMFIRGFECVVKLHCSSDDPLFRVCAVPIHEEPVSFGKPLSTRVIHWFCYLTQYFAKVMFCFSSYENAKRAVVIYLIASLILSFDTSSEKKNDLAKQSPRDHLTDMEAWLDLLLPTCYRWASNRHRRAAAPRTVAKYGRASSRGTTSQGSRTSNIVPVMSAVAPYYSVKSKPLMKPPVEGKPLAALVETKYLGKPLAVDEEAVKLSWEDPTLDDELPVVEQEVQSRSETPQEKAKRLHVHLQASRQKASAGHQSLHVYGRRAQARSSILKYGQVD